MAEFQTGESPAQPENETEQAQGDPGRDVSQLRLRDRMLQSYETQLLAARRIAKFRVRKRIESGAHPFDPDPAPKRRQYRDKAAQELLDAMIFTGTGNPIVDAVKEELGKRLGLEIEFVYVPGEMLMKVVARENGALRQLTPEERAQAEPVLSQSSLFSITCQNVDRQMLFKPNKTARV